MKLNGGTGLMIRYENTTMISILILMILSRSIGNRD